MAVPPSNDPEGKLLKPGIKVLHIPDIDFGTSVLTLVDGLREVRSWSLEHPRHIPIFFLIELKDENLGAGFTRTLPWGQAELAELEREILSVFPREAILMPDDVRGAARTLPEALRQHGWPLLDGVRGKVLFGMDNGGREQKEYLMGHPALEGRILFVSVPPTNPAAAWMERNDPIRDFLEIQNLVKAGFLCGPGPMSQPNRRVPMTRGCEIMLWPAGRNISARTTLNRIQSFRRIESKLKADRWRASTP